MPIRVELTSDAADDLRRYARSGQLTAFLARLVRLEEVGKDAGQPLGRDLTGFRKIVVGDRDWRIIFRMNATDTVATVWAIGDRSDEECYEIAARRLTAAGDRSPTATSLAAAMLQLSRERKR